MEKEEFCVWKVAPEDRMCEFCCYKGGCVMHRDWEEGSLKRIFKEYCDAMSSILGVDILLRCRRRGLVLGRSIVIYFLSKMGFKSGGISELIGLDRSTVIHARTQVEFMLAHPMIYKEEMSIVDKFLKKISNV